jgi:PAT family beta-lactamase induction signal transducer AmpG
LRFFLLFIAAVSGFIAVFIATGQYSDGAKAVLTDSLVNGALAGFVIESARLALALGVAALVGHLLVRAGVTDQQMLESTYVAPIKDFFRRYGLSLAILLLALIACYRVSDIVLGVISNVFYQDLGFEKDEIATVVKTFGLLMTIVGSFAGGFVAMKIGVVRTLFIGGILAALTNLLFLLLAQTGNNMEMLYVVIAADNLCAGFATAAFVAFLSSLTNISFTAVQYAVFSSLMTLLPKLLGGYSGGIVDTIGYPSFFLLTAVLGVPALILIVLISRRIEVNG